MKAQLKKTAVMSLALIAMTFFTFSTASAQRGNQGNGKKKNTKKAVVTKRKVVKQNTQRYNQRTNNRINQRGRVASYPRGSKQMNFRGVNYRVVGNQFYRLQQGRYMRVAPPRGMYYTSMPAGYTKVRRNGGTFYRHNGMYYQRQRNHLGQFIFMLLNA